MPVLSTQAWRLSQQRLTEEEQIQLHKELETCIEVAGTIRNSDRKSDPAHRRVGLSLSAGI